MRIFPLLMVCCVASFGHAQFEWTQLTAFPGAARDDASAFTIGATIFVGTGRDVSFALTNDWYAYDLVSQTWSAIAPLPASGRQYCSAFTDGTFGYLFGGVDASGPLNELWRYDAAHDDWEQRASLPAAGRYATVAFDNGIVCTGLLNGGIPTNECWHYDAAGDSWEQRATMPGPARHRAAGSGSFVQVLGGADQDGNALGDGYVYDVENNTWSPPMVLPAPRIGADAAYDPVFSNTYLVGGASSSTEFHNDAWEGGGASWHPIAPFNGVRRGAVIAFAEDPSTPMIRHVFYGTGVDATQRYNDWWVYTFLTEGIEEHGTATVNAYPNPSSGPIRFDVPPGTYTYEVRDMSGRCVATGTLSDDRTLHVPELRSGRYVIWLIAEGERFRSTITILRP